MNVPIIVFSLSVRICGSLIQEACHWEAVDDFTSEAICRLAGGVMLLYPNVSGYKCVISTREFHLRQNSGNPF